MKKEAAELTELVKTEMENLHLDEIDTGSVQVTYKVVTNTRLNSSAFKAAYPKIYDRYLDTIETMRFTIKANKLAAAVALQATKEAA